MKTRIISVLLLFTVLFMPSICAAYISKSRLPISYFPIYGSKQFHFQPYTRVVINVPMNVQILPNSNSTMQLSGDLQSMRYINTVVVNQTLYINLAPHPKVYLRPVVIKISRSRISQIVDYGSGNVTACNISGLLNVWSQGSGNIYLYGCNLNLHYLQVVGNGNIYIKGIKSSGLDIYAIGPGQIQLAGTAALRHVTYYGNGTLSLYWIDSPCLSITEGGYGRIYVAGITGMIDIVLGDHAFLEARYLHADTGFINTSGCSTATVWTGEKLNTLSTGSSTIYYYNNSPFEAVYMNPPGATLNMTNIPGW